MDAEAGVRTSVPENYRSSARHEVLALLPPLKSGLKILEIGCGEGNFCLTVPNVAEAWGIEPHEPSAAVAARGLHRVFAATFSAVRAELPLHYFDLVICNDVMEHMTDVAAFLNEITAHMAPGAFLVGSVPNVRFSSNLFNLIVARDWHYQDSGILDRTHFRFFTMRSMRRTLEEAAFTVHCLRGLNKAPPRKRGRPATSPNACFAWLSSSPPPATPATSITCGSVSSPPQQFSGELDVPEVEGIPASKIKSPRVNQPLDQTAALRTRS